MTIGELRTILAQSPNPDAILWCDGAEIQHVAYLPDLGIVLLTTKDATRTTPHVVHQGEG